MTVSSSNNVLANLGAVTTHPPVAVASSVATLAATSVLPKFLTWLESSGGNGSGILSNLTTIKVMNLVLYTLCILSVQQPGRIDGRAGVTSSSSSEQQTSNKAILKKISRQTKEQRGGGEEELSVKEMMVLRRQSLFVPSGWAFAIWGVIFLGELLFVTSSAVLVQETSAVAPLYRQVSVALAAAQLCQIMWTRVFRPNFYQGNIMIFLPSLLLSGIAWSLNQAHLQFTTSSSTLLVKGYEYVLYFLPLTLHFGWTTAASLVTWNGNVAYLASVSLASPRWVAVASHVSTVLATALGMGITLTRRAPVFGGVVAWALTGIATEMQQRLSSSSSSSSSLQQQEAKKTFKNVAVTDVPWGLVGARVQKWLSGIGAALSLAASVYVVVTKEE